MELKGSKTEANLFTAYCDESKVSMKYKLFADAAQRQGFEEIASIFRMVSENEKAHAAMWATRLGDIRSVEENLDSASGGENYEGTSLYPSFAETAKSEGFTDLADAFERVAQIELRHSGIFRQFYDCLKNGEMFKSKTSTVWLCRNCGNIFIGTEAPANCANCGYPQAFFQREVNYFAQK